MTFIRPRLRPIFGLLLIVATSLLGSACMHSERTVSPDGPYQGDQFLKNYDETVVRIDGVVVRLQAWAQVNAPFLSRNAEIQKFVSEFRTNVDRLIVEGDAARSAYMLARTGQNLATLQGKLTALDVLLSQAQAYLLIKQTSYLPPAHVAYLHC